MIPRTEPWVRKRYRDTGRSSEVLDVCAINAKADSISGHAIHHRDVVPAVRLGLPPEGAVALAVHVEAKLASVNLVVQITAAPPIVIHDRLVPSRGGKIDPDIHSACGARPEGWQVHVII